MSLPTLRFAHRADAAFRDDLRRDARLLLASQEDHRYGDAGTALKAFSIAIIATALYAGVLRSSSQAVFFIAYVAFLFAAMLLSINVLHDASHRALFRSPALNRWVARLVSIPMGIDSDYWTVRHVHYHHPFANIEGYDLDIAPNPFLRQSPFQRWYSQYRYQHLYWPLVAALSLPYINWVFDWSDRLGRTPLARDRLLPGAKGWAVFLGAKLAHGLLLIALPLWLTPFSFGVVLGAYLLGQMVASCFLVAMILGTHWAGVEFFEPPEDGKTMQHSWLAHAFRTSCDWTSRPRWFGALVGGLNLHLTHHLFPTWSHRHYDALAELIARLARQHQLPYRAVGYRELASLQQAFLREMGRPPAPSVIDKRFGRAATRKP